jgi:hypothetical protein
MFLTRIDNHPQDDLAKFGYRSKRKIENFETPTAKFGYRSMRKVENSETPTAKFSCSSMMNLFNF